MAFKSKVKQVVCSLDKFSPYPVFYQFIMSKAEISIFDEAIKNSQHYLEFGLGGSTIRAIQRSKAKIYTVESSFGWLAYMRRYMIVRFFEGKCLHIHSVNIGPTRDWGFPDNDNDIFEAYSSSIFHVIDPELVDLALVDGRFRVACTLKIIMSCCENSNLKILIHDFWNREQYHILLKYLDTVQKVDTIGLFSIKKSIDMKQVEKDYGAYKFDPQ
jgi:hypothetical protein